MGLCIITRINLNINDYDYYELLSAELQDPSARHLQELRNFDLSKSGQGIVYGKSTIQRWTAEELTIPSMYGTGMPRNTVKLS